MPFTDQQLHDEIEIDPAALGYKHPDATWKGEQEIADLLIAVSAAWKVDRETITSAEVKALIDYDDYVGLTADKRNWVDLILSSETVDFRDAEIREGFGKAFTAGSPTRTNLMAYQQRNASRAEFLWGAGTHITASDVSRVANLG